MPLSRVNDVKKVRLPSNTRSLRRLLCKTVFAPQMFLTRQTTVQDELSAMTRLTPAEFRKEIVGERARRALNFVLHSASVNPLTPVPVDECIEGNWITIGMPDSCSAGYGSVLLGVSTADFKATSPDKCSRPLTDYVYLHAVKGGSIAPELRDRAGSGSAYKELVSSCAHYSYIDYQVQGLLRYWVSDSDNLVKGFTPGMRITDNSLLTLLGVMQSFFNQPNLLRLHSGGPSHVLDDWLSRECATTVVANSVTQQRFTSPQKVLQEMFPHIYNFKEDDMATTGESRKLEQADYDAVRKSWEEEDKQKLKGKGKGKSRKG